MVYSIGNLVKMVIFRTFARNILYHLLMTICEACKQVLNDLGGRASLADIYERVKMLVKFTGATPNASIRAELQNHPLLFRRTPDKRGWWELVSYQEDLAKRDKRIAELEAEVEQLKKVPTEDDFVKKLLAVTKRLYKRDEAELDVVRKLFFTVGRKDAEEELDNWIEGRESKHAVAIGKLEFRQGGTNIDTNFGPNIEHNGGTLSLPGKMQGKNTKDKNA